MDIKSEIIKAIDERFKVLKDSLKFDKTYYGKILDVNNEFATVEIYGSVYTAKMISGINIANGDVVVVKSPNDNFSDLYVAGKLGNEKTNLQNQMYIESSGEIKCVVNGSVDTLVRKSYVDEQIKILSDQIAKLQV